MILEALMRTEALDQRALEEIGRLNLAFLKLLVDYRGSSLERSLVGDTAAIAGLYVMAPRQLENLARIPVALFSLPGCPSTAAVCEHPVSRQAGDAGIREFGLVASCFAWHLCFNSPLAASMLLGWPRSRCRTVGSCNLASLVQSTSRCWPAVRLRMPRNPRFWGDLMRCAQENDETSWEVARVWGTQFMSSEA